MLFISDNTARKLYDVVKMSINMDTPTGFRGKLTSSGRHQYKGVYNINASILHVQS